MSIELTPLKATLLLIVFSLALGSVVLAWGEDFVSAEATELTSNAVCPLGCVPANFAGGSGVEGSKNIISDNKQFRGVWWQLVLNKFYWL